MEEEEVVVGRVIKETFDFLWMFFFFVLGLTSLPEHTVHATAGIATATGDGVLSRVPQNAGCDWKALREEGGTGRGADLASITFSTPFRDGTRGAVSIAAPFATPSHAVHSAARVSLVKDLVGYPLGYGSVLTEEGK